MLEIAPKSIPTQIATAPVKFEIATTWPREIQLKSVGLPSQLRAENHSGWISQTRYLRKIDLSWQVGSGLPNAAFPGQYIATGEGSITRPGDETTFAFYPKSTESDEQFFVCANTLTKLMFILIPPLPRLQSKCMPSRIPLKISVSASHQATKTFLRTSKYSALIMYLGKLDRVRR